MSVRLASGILRGAVAALAQTWSVRVTDEQHLKDLRASGVPRIVVLWHHTLLPLFWWHRREGTTLLVSGHRDGGHLARAAGKWGYGVIRGSSSRHAVPAVRRLLGVLASGGEVALTPDGPRGPAAVAKPGAVRAAQQAGAAVVPVGCWASSMWRLNSWDALAIPRPFAEVRVVYGAPFRVAPGAAGLAEGLDRLQRGLDMAAEAARC